MCASGFDELFRTECCRIFRLLVAVGIVAYLQTGRFFDIPVLQESLGRFIKNAVQNFSPAAPIVQRAKTPGGFMVQRSDVR